MLKKRIEFLKELLPWCFHFSFYIDHLRNKKTMNLKIKSSCNFIIKHKIKLFFFPFFFCFDIPFFTLGMNSVFDEDRFSLTNVSLLDENVSYASHNHLTTSPTPLHNTKSRSNGTRRHSVEDTSAVKNLDKDARNTTTSLKSQESVNRGNHKCFISSYSHCCIR